MSKSNLTPKGENLINLLNSGYLCMDLKGCITDANTVAEDMLGFAKGELEGGSFFKQWISPEASETLVQQVLKLNHVHDFDIEVKHHDGAVLHLSLNAQLVHCPVNHQQGIECLLYDAGGNAHSQQAFDETLRNISGSVAHLINNQMVSVVGNANLMKKELSHEPKLAEKLNRISTSGLDASGVAHGLVEYADTQELENLQPVCLRQISAFIAEQYNNEIFQVKPRKVSFEMAKELPAFLGSQEQIMRLVSYLLDNAIEATESGGTIIVSTKVTSLKQKNTQANAEYVELAVEDHGHGMDPDTQRRIFEPFFSTRFMGRGMSLAHALKIIKIHKGRVHVKTGPGKGSIFKVYFPLVNDEQNT